MQARGVEVFVTVEIVQPRPSEWAARFLRERDRISAVVPDARIEHIGSTAVPGMPAKDAVDVLVGVPAERVVAATRTLVQTGYDCEGERVGHAWLSSPDRAARETVVHVVPDDGQSWRERIAFRDLLREDAGARVEYLAAKLSAAAASEGWDDYTPRKASVVRRLLRGRELRDDNADRVADLLAE